MTKALRNYHGNLKSNLHNFDETPPAFELGGGYSSDRQMPTYITCLLNGTKTFSGDSKSTLFFGDSRSFDEFEKDLNVDVTASASIGLFSADLSASYARHVKDTVFTQSFYYSEKVILPTEIFHPADFGENALDPFGKAVYQQGPDKFRTACGDQVVQQNHLGASLYVTLKVHFNTIDDKTTFTANAGVKYGSMFSMSAKISQVVSEHHVQGQLEVSALQVGGDATALAKIFSSGPDPYAVTSCSLEDLVSCQKTINGVLAYAANDFPGQINFQNGTVFGSASSEGYTFMPFTHLGLEIGDSIITPEVESAREDLGNLYLQLQDKQVFITHIMQSPIFNSFFNDIKDRIKNTADHLNYNVKLLNNLDTGVMRCYNSPEKCQTVLNDMNQKLQPIDENLIDLIKDSYNFDVIISNCGFDNGDCLEIAHGSSIVMPIDKEGHFHWDYLGHNNTLTIIENNDGTISLGINGGLQYPEIQRTKQGQYEIHNARCLETTDPIPYPFNEQCHDTYIEIHGIKLHFWGEADMALQSIEDVF